MTASILDQVASIINRTAKISVVFDSVGRRDEYVSNAKDVAEAVLAGLDRILRDERHDLIAAAYEQGCHDVHANYEPQPDPEFGEAASDYAASAVDNLKAIEQYWDDNPEVIASVVCGFCRASFPDETALADHVATRHGPGDRTGQRYLSGRQGSGANTSAGKEALDEHS